MYNNIIYSTNQHKHLNLILKLLTELISKIQQILAQIIKIIIIRLKIL